MFCQTDNLDGMLTVVIHRGDKGNDQSSRPADVNVIPAPIGVLPENAVVFLVETNGIFGN